MVANQRGHARLDLERVDKREELNMSKFAIIATIEVSPGRLDEYLPLVMAHRTRCLQDEPGTLQFEVLRPHDDQTALRLYEVYLDKAAFDVHWNGPSRARHDAEAAGMVAKLSGTFCTLLD